MNTPLTTEQENALQQFANRHGRCWKSRLKDAWQNGSDERLPNGALLRQLRNQLGPEGLRGIEVKPTQSGFPRFNVTFESTGVTQDAAVLDATCTEQEAAGFNDTLTAEGGFPPGILAVAGGYITSDDGQGDCDIKVFASVTLLVEAASEAQAQALPPPADLLTKVADMMGTLPSGQCPLELEPNAWRVVEVEPIAGVHKKPKATPGLGM